jgi:hypothetical protein
MWFCCTAPYNLLLYSCSWWPLNLQCTVCNFHPFVFALANLQGLPISLLLLLGDFYAWHHVWDSVDEGKLPPWVTVSFHCDTHFCNLPKTCMPPDTFCRLCTEMFIHYPDHTVIFTDGSVMNGSVCHAFVINRNPSKFWLNSSNSIFLPSSPLHSVRHLML